MDFDSPDPDVEKDFPGLYGSDSGGSRKREDEDCKHSLSCFCLVTPTLFSINCLVRQYIQQSNNYFLVSEGDHEKVSKKEILLGRRKDKKDKKDKGYAALDGESSQEEDLDTK